MFIVKVCKLVLQRSPVAIKQRGHVCISLGSNNCISLPMACMARFISTDSEVSFSCNQLIHHSKYTSLRSFEWLSMGEDKIYSQLYTEGDNLLARIKDTREPDELLQLFLDSDQSSSLSKEHFCETLVKLWHLQSRHEVNPLSLQCRQHYCDIVEHPGFSILCQRLHDDLETLSNSELVSCLLHLLRFRVNKHHPLVTKLLLICEDRLLDAPASEESQLNVEHLTRLSLALTHVEPHSMSTLSYRCKIVNILGKYLDTHPKLSSDDIWKCVIALTHLRLVASNSIRVKVVNYVAQILPSLSPEQLPLYMFCHINDIFIYPTIPKHQDIGSIQRHMIGELAQRLDELDATLVHHFASHLVYNNMGCVSTELEQILSLLEGRAAVLLDTAESPVQRIVLAKSIVDIMLHKNKQPLSGLSSLEAGLCEDLSQYGRDIVLCPALFHHVTHLLMRMRNKQPSGMLLDIVADVGWPPIERVRPIYLLNAARLTVGTETFTHPALTECVHYIEHALEHGELGLIRWNVVNALCFLIHYCRDKPALPAVVAEKIKAFAPTFTLRDIRYITGQVDTAWRFNRSLAHELMSIQYVLLGALLKHRDIVALSSGEKLEDNSSKLTMSDVKKYIDMVDILVKQVNSVDITLLDKVLSHLKIFCEELTPRISLSILRCLRIKLYYAPELLESISGEIRQRQVQGQNDAVGEQFPSSVVTQYAITCFKLGYVPQHVEQLFDVILHSLSIDDTMPETYIRLATAFSFFHHLPRSFVMNIINTKFLASVDEQLKRKTQHGATMLRENLVDLNRTLCLEWPEYNIPWFHDGYCAQNFTQECQRSLRGRQEMVNDMYRNLCGILGGEQYCTMHAHSPYYHHIHFLCLLDSNEEPLNYMQHRHLLDKSDAASDIKKVAILALTPYNWCANLPSKPSGLLQTKLKHLQILGYTPVVINRDKWNAMYLSEPSAKFTYLSRKIFTKDLQPSTTSQHVTVDRL